jgi:hypothetical protein
MVDVWEVFDRFELINYFLQVQKLESKLCSMVLLAVGRASHLQCLVHWAREEGRLVFYVPGG